MNNLVVGLNGGVNRVTSARVVEGIGAYSNPFRPAPIYHLRPENAQLQRNSEESQLASVSHASQKSPTPGRATSAPNLQNSTVTENEESRIRNSHAEESATACGVRHHRPTFGTSSGCDVKQLPAFAKPGHTFRFITKTVIFSILIILIPVWAGFGLPGWVAWLCLIAFLAGLRQANRDYDLLVSPSTTRYKSKTVSKANASCVEVVADTANSVTGSHAVTKDKRRAEKFSSYNSLLSHFSPGASLSVSHKNKQGTGNGALL